MEYDRKRDPDKFQHIWRGEYLRNSEARVFRNWKVEDFDTLSNAMFRFGADWGFASDPTVLVRCYIDGRTLYIDHEAWQIGCDIIDTPELFMSIQGAEKWPIVADSSRPETISHMRRHGFPKMLAAVKGQKSVEEGIEWLKSYDIVVHPRCTHTIDELSLYSYKTDTTTGAVLPVLEDKKNHVIDALRYALDDSISVGEILVSRPGMTEEEASAGLPLAIQVHNFERKVIAQALHRHQGNISEVMKELDLPRRTLNQKMQKFGLLRGDFTAQEE
jgi:phage terminase large subunit